MMHTNLRNHHVLGIRVLKKPHAKTLRWLLIVILINPMLYLIMHALHLSLTFSGSVPVGVYQMTNTKAEQVQVGDYVVFCLPKLIAQEGMKKGYLHAGTCSSGAEVLIKKVIAVPGDQVDVEDNAIQVEKQHYLAPRNVLDFHHKSVRKFISVGHYVSHGYWMYGDGKPEKSWDSRFYGEIRVQDILGRMRPLFIF